MHAATWAGRTLLSGQPVQAVTSVNEMTSKRPPAQHVLRRTTVAFARAFPTFHRYTISSTVICRIPLPASVISHPADPADESKSQAWACYVTQSSVCRCRCSSIVSNSSVLSPGAPLEWLTLLTWRVVVIRGLVHS